MTLLEEIGTYLQTDLSLGTLGTNIFLGFMPDSPDAAIAVLDTGGMEPSPDVPTHHPTFQVLIRSTSYETGRTKLDTVRNNLHREYNELVSGQTYFFFILAMSEGGHIGRDDAGRDLFSINFHAQTR